MPSNLSFPHQPFTLLTINHLLLSLCLIPVGSYTQTANRFDIIITELLPDPSPAIGLPNSEFIELKNNSSTPISLRNWKLSDGSATTTINSDFILQPDSFVIICPNNAAPSFISLGKTVGVSNFPSLNNDRDIIILYSPEGKIIHAIEYSNTWYQNDIKREGGWTLEMIDTKNPCTGTDNWKASTNTLGGTPGSKNAVDADNPDDLPPAVFNTYTIDSNTIVAVFDEPLDINSAAILSNYSIDKNIGQPFEVRPIAPFYKEVMLKFSATLSPHIIYQLTVNNVADCVGNLIGAINKTFVGIPTAAQHFDIVINEILFNPPPGGYDYIELYNRSNKIIDLQQLYLSNINAAGNLTNIQQLSTQPKPFFPGTYYVFTENASWLRQHYLLNNHQTIIELPAFPSMPDDQSHIAITNIQGNRTDHLHYNKKWHFALIDNEDGVSLERINYNDSTQNKNNWTSAASTTNFGTPGYQNSQFRADLSAQGIVAVSPKIFSPDNSGNDNFTTIHCQLTEPGYVANITIYDDKGRRVRFLVQNVTMGMKAKFHWDGTDEQQKKLPIGQYIILTEIFNLQGKTKKFKNVVVLARKL